VPDVPLREAADRLGVAPEALRKRLQRGSLLGRKVEGEWYVALPEAPDAPSAHQHDALVQDAPAPDGRQDMSGTWAGHVRDGAPDGQDTSGTDGVGVLPTSRTTGASGQDTGEPTRDTPPGGRNGPSAEREELVLLREVVDALRVELEARRREATAARRPVDPGDGPAAGSIGSDGQPEGGGEAPGRDPAMLQAAARAEEMARYTATLLEPWRRRVEELSQDVGRLTAERDEARRKVAEYEAVTEELEREHQADAPPHRPWWRFWG
jgi:hypothetical protein